MSLNRSLSNNDDLSSQLNSLESILDSKHLLKSVRELSKPSAYILSILSDLLTISISLPNLVEGELGDSFPSLPSLSLSPSLTSRLTYTPPGISQHTLIHAPLLDSNEPLLLFSSFKLNVRSTRPHQSSTRSLLLTFVSLFTPLRSHPLGSDITVANLHEHSLLTNDLLAEDDPVIQQVRRPLS